VEETDEVMLMTDSGKIIRMPIEGVSVISRNTQGVKLMGMAPGERMAGAARLVEQEEDDGETEDDAADMPDEDAGESDDADNQE